MRRKRKPEPSRTVTIELWVTVDATASADDIGEALKDYLYDTLGAEPDNAGGEEHGDVLLRVQDVTYDVLREVGE